LRTEKFNITLDARMINHSGIGTNIKNMIPNLVENYKLTLLGNSEVLNSFPWSKGTRIVDMRSPIYSVKEQIELPFKIPNCDLFVSPHYNIPLFKIKARKRVVIINDVNHLVFADQLSFPKVIYAKYMINAAIRKSDKVITLSEFSKSEISKYANVKGKDIKIVYCGLDIEELKTKMNELSFDQVRAIYKLPEDYFLYMGNIKPHKNLKTCLKAFNLWSKKYPSDKKLVIIGVKPDDINKDSGLSKLLDKNSLIIAGFIKDSDLPLIYNNAECLIFPSIYEGFGLPPLEAMIYGCPVIASNSASIPEVCGDAALYFEPFKFEELAEKMQMLTNNKGLRTELIEKGYTNSLRFSRKRFAQNLKREFDDTIIN
jgi:glycosyltransferase involved in cell wall biosynthesis